MCFSAKITFLDVILIFGSVRLSLILLCARDVAGRQHGAVGLAIFAEKFRNEKFCDFCVL